VLKPGKPDKKLHTGFCRPPLYGIPCRLTGDCFLKAVIVESNNRCGFPFCTITAQPQKVVT
jgi:hypothetical protein